MYYQIAFNVPLYKVFTYLSKSELVPGARVLAPFGKKQLVGVVIAKCEQPNFDCKPIIQVLDNSAIFNVGFLAKVADYYLLPIGEVIFSAIPKKAREQNVPEREASEISFGEFATLTNEQASVVKDTKGICLLEGATGSGKTQIYLELAKKELEQGRQVIVLVPEIGLAPQTFQRFEACFPNQCLVNHSEVSDKKRSDAWWDFFLGVKNILITTRSGVLWPCKKLGLIVVDEEHDDSFKAMDGVRLNARDLAIWRATVDNIPCILGSATPSLESLYNAKLGKYQHLLLQNRYNTSHVPIEIINTKGVKGAIAPATSNAIEQTLAKGGQVMVFLNRRGYAPCWFCTECGYIQLCAACDFAATFHAKKQLLKCHRCEDEFKPQETCPSCSNALKPVGVGTEQLTELLIKQFDSARVSCIDRDTTSGRGKLAEKLSQVHDGLVDIIVGTQMISKGHHFANLDLVVIVDIDASMYSSDHRALEKMGQQVIQVAGRAGREKTGRVLLQTQLNDPRLQLLIEQGYSAFATCLLEERATSGLPPYQSSAVVRATGRNESQVKTQLKQFKSAMSSFQDITVIGPTPCLMSKLNNNYRWQLVVLSTKRSSRNRALATCQTMIGDTKKSGGVKVLLDVDPVDML